MPTARAVTPTPRSDLKKRLHRLRRDYETVCGRPFSWFFCPILFRDEDVELCKGHLVNKAFPASSRRWTVQRKDVDNFYGRNFEQDFLDIQHRDRDALEILSDPKLSRRFRPKIYQNEVEVQYFRSQSKIPAEFTLGFATTASGPVPLALKRQNPAGGSPLSGKWEIEWGRDLRPYALPSLLKAAHLTLFDVLGYRYVLSPGGQFLGGIILGSAFEQCSALPKEAVLARTRLHFERAGRMIRLVDQEPPFLETFSKDRLVTLACGSPGTVPWGLVVFIRIMNQRHAVLLPTFPDEAGVDQFRGFLDGRTREIPARPLRHVQDHWEIHPRPIVTLVWPEM